MAYNFRPEDLFRFGPQDDFEDRVGNRANRVDVDARDDAFAADETTPVTGNVFANNGSGADKAGKGNLAVVLVEGQPMTVGQTITLDSGALLTLNEDGSFSYDQNGAFDALTGSDSATDSFTYTAASDRAPLARDQATVTITINGDNAAPVFTAGPVFVQDLTTLSASQGFIIQGDAAGDQAGASVSSAGDVNGDGFDDLIVGAPFGDDDGGFAGEAYVVFGAAGGFGAADGAGRQVIDLTDLSASEGFIIQGDAGGDFASRSVSSAGDVNGDGYDDVIVGARNGDDGGDLAGEAYVVFGTAGGFGVADGAGRQVIDLTTLSSSEGFIIQGDAGFDNAGWSVSAAGDVNGDGYDDLIVGAPGGDDGGSFAGEAYVVFGAAGGFGAADGAGRQVIDLTDLSPTEGFIIQGDAAFDNAAASLSSAGDVNGDGYDDLIVGAPFGDDGGGNAGEAYVVFGASGGFGTADGSGRQVIDLTDLSSSEGFIIQGDEANNQAGYSVSSAGDVNGDGYDDLIVGARYGDDDGDDAGEAYVVFGAAGGFGTADGVGRQVIDLTDLSSSDGFIIQGDAAYDQAGFSVSSAGDVNGDGFDDLIVGAPYGDDGGAYAGEAYVVFGAAGGFGAADGAGRQVVDLTTLSSSEGFIIQGDVAYDNAGFSVSSAGDVNGDGYDDLIVGGPFGDDGGVSAGEAYVIYGHAEFGGVLIAAAENQTDTGYTASATDPDAGDTISFSLSGDDAALFSIDATTGELTFDSAPDFETPGDADGDNAYEIDIIATDDGGLTDSQHITVVVTDVSVETAQPPGDAAKGEGADDDLALALAHETAKPDNFGDVAVTADASPFVNGGHLALFTSLATWSDAPDGLSQMASISELDPADWML